MTRRIIDVLLHTYESGNNVAYNAYPQYRYYWYPSMWAPTLSVYFEAVLKADAGEIAYVQLLNETDGVAINNTELSNNATTYARKRSGDIKFDMPTSPKELVPQMRTSLGVFNWYLGIARLIIVVP